MNIKEFREEYNKSSKEFRDNVKEIRELEKQISGLDSEIKGLKLERDKLFVIPGKQVKIVIKALMLLALVLVESAFFMYFGPQILAIPDIFIKTLFGMLALVSGGIMVLCFNKFTNKMVKKAIIISNENIVKSEEYKKYSDIISEKMQIKNKLFNTVSQKRRGIANSTLENCKSLIRLNDAVRENDSEFAQVDEDKPLKRIRIINKRN